MRPTKNYSSWMAEQIAKTYLLQIDFLSLNEDPTRKFDFLVLKKEDTTKQIGIEVKASRYRRSELLREYFEKRKRFKANRFPVIMFYIDYMERTGCIEVINKSLNDNLIDLNTANLSKEIKQLWETNKTSR